MFTGIVSAVGTVVSAEPNRLAIEHAATSQKLVLGASIAVNGCCLTVVKKSRGTFFADVVPETLRRTNLGALKPGAQGNLELPLAASGRLAGHFVQGHDRGSLRAGLRGQPRSRRPGPLRRRKPAPIVFVKQ